MTIFKECYEVVEPARKKAQAFAARQKEAMDAQWKLVKALGGVGYRPGYGGRIKSVMFKETDKAPTGWRRLGFENGTLECVPSRNTKIGQELAAQLEAAPNVEDWGRFANEFGWKSRAPIDCERGRIYHAAGVRLTQPKERFILQLPRTLDDGWEKPAGLKEIRESDMLRAIEDHNALAKKLREGGVE